MLLSSLGNVLVSRIRMFNLELSLKTKREFLHISCVWDQRLLSYRPIYQFHISQTSCKLFTSTLSKVSLILICESILFRSSYFFLFIPLWPSKNSRIRSSILCQAIYFTGWVRCSLFVCFSLQGSSCHVAVRLFLSHEL